MARVGDTAPDTPPLGPLRILDFSRILAGPFATMLLADLGADVVKVERPGAGDETRSWGPPFDGQGRATYFQSVNRNKRSVVLDLTAEADLARARELARNADVVVENFRPDVMDKLGLGYAQLSAENPRLIFCSITGFGAGAGAELPGYDLLVQALGGLMSITGAPDGEPQKVGVALVDVLAGLFASVGILAALRHRDRTGEGQQVELAQIESTVSALGPYLMEYANNGEIAQPSGNRIAWAAPHGAFPAAGDDRWCVIAVFDDAQWETLCDAMHDPAWAHEERFATLLGRKQHEDALEEGIAAWTRTLPAEQIADLLQARGVPAGVVQNAEDVLDKDPHIQARQFYQYIDHPEAGRNAYDGMPQRLSATPGRIAAPAPLLGQHNEYVLEKLLGVGGEQLTELLVEQVIF
jgi:crotonobetainyl-CoA:carnitine CoA-transferase CaiB-like acyl-CoA transferase